MKLNTLIFILSIFTTNIFAQVVMPVEKITETETPASPTTTMEFEETSFDFGVVDQGEKVSYVYKFENTGDLPLVITNAKGSCGCTVPKYPKEPILPGEKAELTVEFNTKGKKGMQSKRVTITANTYPAQSYLTIKGEVLEGENDTAYPTEDLAKEKSKKTELSNHSENVTSLTENKLKQPKDCFAIFPNPTTDILKLDLNKHQGKAVNISIYNSNGQKLNSRAVSEVTDEILEFEVYNYAPGTYYINVQIESEIVSTKCFVVARH